MTRLKDHRTNSNNTAIREYLLGNGGGSWDGLDDKYSQAAGFAKNLYVQPYILKVPKIMTGRMM